MSPRIDLRSDTVTKPSPAMLDAMMRAEVGDDVFGEDPTVNRLEEMGAAMFGMEAGLFCPSGTMTNQIAIKLQTQPMTEVILEETSHTYLYEVGGISFLSGAQVRLLKGDRGRITAQQVEEALGEYNVHLPDPVLVSLENSHNRGGGSVYDLGELKRIRKSCLAHGLRLHLDGARIFNAIVATGTPATDFGKLFDTLSVCLSKGLGAPMGSLLLGNKADIKKARKIRKALGGGMRQAGYVAAAGIYALEHHIPELANDHTKAKQVAGLLSSLAWVESVLTAETNIVVFKIVDSLHVQEILNQFSAGGIGAVQFGKQAIRMVLHRDISTSDMTEIADFLGNFNPLAFK